jgi:hypothetical protein
MARRTPVTDREHDEALDELVREHVERTIEKAFEAAWLDPILPAPAQPVEEK